MRTLAWSLTLACCLCVPVLATERFDHHEGRPSADFAAAIDNLAHEHGRLRDWLASPELGLAELAAIHESTYTMEHAIERLRKQLDAAAASLEEMHLASERADAEAVRLHGRNYLQGRAPGAD